MPILDQDDLYLLFEAAVARGLPREALLAGLPPSYVGSLESAKNANGQILQDLQRLNSDEALLDGTVPLRSWLRSAVAQTKVFLEGAVFADGLRKVDHELLGPKASAVSDALAGWKKSELQALARQRLAAWAAPYRDGGDAFPVVRDAAATDGRLDALITAALAQRLDAAILLLAEQRGLAVKVPFAANKLEGLVHANTPFEDVPVWRTRLARHEATVCRIEIDDRAAGTGFLVGPDLLLTAHHVVAGLFDRADALAHLKFRFDFMRSTDGNHLLKGTLVRPAADWKLEWATAAPFELDPQAPVRELRADELDFALIRLERPVGDAPVGTENVGADGRSRGWIHLQSDAALAPFDVNNVTLILQHPEGDALQLMIGTILARPPQRVRYDANTAHGSSGSPCFNFALNLIALHHSGDAKAKGSVYNQGVPTAQIAAACEKAGIELREPPE